MARTKKPNVESPRQLLVGNMDLVERLVAYVCARNHFRGDEAEEFGAEVRLALVEDDYRILRGFRDESRLSTYLTAVILNFARDFRTKRCGRWRPCAAARRLGVIGVELDTLLNRDGFSLPEAGEILRARHGNGLMDSRVSSLARQLPARMKRRTVALDGEDAIHAPIRADSRLVEREEDREERQTWAALSRVLDELPAEDRLILRMRFDSGLTIAAIARSLGLDQRRLYRRFETLLACLRRRLVEACSPRSGVPRCAAMRRA